MVSNTGNGGHHDLLEAAMMAGQRAYAPYSGFRVGAAVRAEEGIFVGANVESASYNLGICAERVALAGAIASGQGKISAIAIACIDADASASLNLRVPCGACRQWLSELAPDAEIVLLGVERVFKVSDLLPIPFEL